MAILEAMGSPMVEDHTDPAGYITFLKIAQSLQRQLPTSSFMLPCHKLAPMLACQPMTISRYRNVSFLKKLAFRILMQGQWHANNFAASRFIYRMRRKRISNLANSQGLVALATIVVRISPATRA